MALAITRETAKWSIRRHSPPHQAAPQPRGATDKQRIVTCVPFFPPGLTTHTTRGIPNSTQSNTKIASSPDLLRGPFKLAKQSARITRKRREKQRNRTRGKLCALSNQSKSRASSGAAAFQASRRLFSLRLGGRVGGAGKDRESTRVSVAKYGKRHAENHEAQYSGTISYQYCTAPGGKSQRNKSGTCAEPLCSAPPYSIIRSKNRKQKE